MIAAHCESCWLMTSTIIRTVRSRTSGDASLTSSWLHHLEDWSLLTGRFRPWMRFLMLCKGIMRCANDLLGVLENINDIFC